MEEVCFTYYTYLGSHIPHRNSLSTDVQRKFSLVRFVCVCVPCTTQVECVKKVQNAEEYTNVIATLSLTCCNSIPF